MDSFSKCVFVRAGKHTSVHDVHPHSNATCLWIQKAGEHHIITYNIIYITWLENVDADMAEEKCARNMHFFYIDY